MSTNRILPGLVGVTIGFLLGYYICHNRSEVQTLRLERDQAQTELNRIKQAKARKGSEEAFGELVHRHIDLVYSTAFRVLQDASLAEDVTQRLFIALFRNATHLGDRAVLTGWLHETARNFAITTVRSEERRRLQEQEAATMKILDSNDPHRLWPQVAPVLDNALAQLSAGDRDVIR